MHYFIRKRHFEDFRKQKLKDEIAAEEKSTIGIQFYKAMFIPTIASTFGDFITLNRHQMPNVQTLIADML